MHNLAVPGVLKDSVGDQRSSVSVQSPPGESRSHSLLYCSLCHGLSAHLVFPRGVATSQVSRTSDIQKSVHVLTIRTTTEVSIIVVRLSISHE